MTREQYNERVAAGLDPLTGEPMTTKGIISIYHPVTHETRNGVCFDETGRELTLNGKGTWVYV